MNVVLIGSVVFSREMLEVLIAHKSRTMSVAAVLGVAREHSRGISDYADLAPLAESACIAYHPFHRINAESVLRLFRKTKPDYTFVLGLSQLVSGELLQLAGATIGTHPSLLPDGRGRAAIPWSILLGWKKSGVSFFQITEAIDDGPIYEQEAWDITADDDAESLYAKMCGAGRAAFERLLGKIDSGHLIGRPQGTSRIGPLPRRRPADGRVDSSMLAGDVERLIRATTRPYPGAFAAVGPGFPSAKLVLWKSGGLVETAPAQPGTIIDSGPSGLIIACMSGAVRVTEVEFEGTNVRLRPGDEFSRVFKKGQRLL